MRKNDNSEHIEGRIYQHNLAIKTVQNQASANYGKEFIAGNLEVATDEAGLNVLPIHFTYVTETTAKGAKNFTFTSLKKIIDEGKSWITSGKNEATMVRVTNINMALNDFYGQDGNLVSAKTNEGGFVTIVSELAPNEEDRNTFTCDAVLTNVSEVEEDEEKGINQSYLVVKGAVFNFRNDLLPFDFVAKDPESIHYFEQLDISPKEPVYTKIWGRINCSTIVIPHTEETAFGKAVVTNSTRKTKEWEITAAAKIPYEFDDESTITRAELVKAMQDREVYLADVKRRSDEYRATRATAATQSFSSGSAMNMPINAGTFNF